MAKIGNIIKREVCAKKIEIDNKNMDFGIIDFCSVFIIFLSEGGISLRYSMIKIQAIKQANADI